MGQHCPVYVYCIPLSMKLHTVKSVEDDGFTIMLETPLAYTHFGITESFEDGQFIDIRFVFSMCICIII